MKRTALTLFAALVLMGVDAPATQQWPSQTVLDSCKDVPCGVHDLAVPSAPATPFWKGVGYANGWWNLPIDYDRALQLLRRSGTAQAQEAIGELYARGGPNLPRDTDAAAAWLNKAALGGSAAAHLRLAMLADAHELPSGAAVPLDGAASNDNQAKSAEGSPDGATSSAGSAFQAHAYHNDDLGVAAAQYRAAADGGVSAAAYEFALRAQTGTGMERDCTLARTYFKLAAAKGLAQATLALQKLRCP